MPEHNDNKSLETVIYPAIDLRQGQVVRLQLGDPARQTVFNDDPVATAVRWIEAGATWLHVVNLDGAFADDGAANWRVLPELTALSARVQFGGGMRTLTSIDAALARGVARVVLGTVAAEQPALVAEAVRRHGAGRVAVGIDARDGLVRTHGWQSGTALSPLALAQQMAALGVETIIYTDISRDGVLSGVNAAATAELARGSSLAVIASGGVAGLEDVRRITALRASGVDGLIIGRALYDGRIALAEALDLARQPHQAS